MRLFMIIENQLLPTTLLHIVRKTSILIHIKFK